jgi:hypothetical protein
MMSQPIKWLEEGALPRESLCNVHYKDFVSDPMAVIERIYEFFDLELTDEGRTAMQRYMDENPRSGRPAHEYDVGTAEEIEMEREAFAEYQGYFDVPNEI